MRAVDHPLYSTWRNMRQRCNNSQCKDYLNYGGRGIYIASEWNDFWTFAKDMGDRPEGFSVERKDNDGPYAPWNCVWDDRGAQRRNQRKYRQRHFEPRIYLLPNGTWSLRIKKKTIQVFESKELAEQGRQLLMSQGISVHVRGGVSLSRNRWRFRLAGQKTRYFATKEEALAYQSQFTETKNWQTHLCSCGKCRK